MTEVISEAIRLIEASEKTIPTELLFLLLVLGLLIFFWDLFDRNSRKIQKSGGFDEKVEVIALRGSDMLPGKDFSSAKLGLSSRPDALVKSGGFIIPVDRKPTGNKVRDRHILHILVHLRLIEELEGKKPPYGILLMGKEVRTVRVKNTEERQRWLDSLLDEMRSVIDGVPAVPAPARMKCKACDVRDQCKYSAYTPRAKPRSDGN